MVIYYLPIPIPDFIARIGAAIALAYRKIRYGHAFRRIKLTQNKFAIVDAGDFEALNQFEWFALKNFNTFYARRMIYINGKGKAIHMHRVVMKYEGELFVDHINGNGLDNRKDNLRLATPEENKHNSRKRGGRGQSKYKGVTLDKKKNRWRVRIGYKGKRIFLGCFDDEIEAAKAYDGSAKELYGEYARLNFKNSI